MICNVFRADRGNSGDWYSPPFRYFDFLGGEWIDIYGKDVPPRGSLVVIGGGGLISPQKGFKKIRWLLKHRTCVIWGAGENWVIDVKAGYLPQADIPLPSYLKRARLLGLRDYTGIYNHVPCASCMHEAFNRDYEIERRIGFYCHKRIDLPANGHEMTTNDGNDLEEKLAFLGGCEYVVTNSYHGAYWAALLGRRVACIPFGSKFYRLNAPVVFTKPDNLSDQAILGRDYPSTDGYLEFCRRKNREFGRLVNELSINLKV
jgi:hypothetical protein